jgi:hypothetical protein
MAEAKRSRRYYELFQVEDVISFFNGQLILARSKDGNQVYLQEMKKTRPLPPGSTEILANLENIQMVPVLDVIEEKDRVVLVHPSVSAEPLSLLVNRENPLNPVQALNIYRKLLRTVIRLSRLPLPLHSTMDPRNIIMEGERPYLLFVSFEKFQGQDQQWRLLLYFLLTGIRLEAPLAKIEDDPYLQEVPAPLKSLLSQCMDPKKSMSAVLQQAEQIRLSSSSRKTVAKPAKRLRLGLGIAVLLLVGIFFGYQVMALEDAPAGERVAVQKPNGKAGWKKEVSRISFENEGRNMQSLPFAFQGATHVYGEFSQQRQQPFTVTLASENISASFGLHIDDEGQVRLFQNTNGETFSLAGSEDAFRLKPGKTYRMEIYYVPQNPFRVAITDKETGKKWIATGEVPMDSTYRVSFQGARGTLVLHPGAEQITNHRSSLAQWRGHGPFELTAGSAVLTDGNFQAEQKAYIRVPEKFSFQRSKEYEGDPLQLEMESADGSRYRLLWSKDGKLELYRLGYQVERLATTFLYGDWEGDQPAEVTLVKKPRQLEVNVKQGSNTGQLVYKYERPVSLRSIYLSSDSDLELKE